MRKLLFGLFFLAATSPLFGQQTLASVTVEARLRIPDFLSVERVDEGATVRGYEGTLVRRVTVYVKANRAWSLDVKPADPSAKLNVRVVDGELTGKSGNQVPVTLEVSWNATDPPPTTNSLRYVLAAN